MPFDLSKINRDENGKVGAIGLIREYFGMAGSSVLSELKAVPRAEQIQLGSAIARAEGVGPELLNFETVEY